jgi:uncharacterized phage protein gp47/JayE
MPWTTPTLKQVRSLVRDNIRGSLPGADAMVPNSVLRVLSDSQGALCHLTLQYIDWLALQLLPDTAETEWLDRHGDIWLVNADGTTGRKLPTLALGTVQATTTTISTVVMPIYTQLQYSSGTNTSTGAIGGWTYETTAAVTVGAAPTTIPVRALDPGSGGNRSPGDTLGLTGTILGINSVVTVLGIDGGTDTETDDELRARILLRIQQPPMGGDATDYEQWALAVPGVTRAWPFPQEMGIGTMTLRFMMDDLRAANGGFPMPDDVDDVAAYINTVRPVTVKDMFVESPIPYPVNVHINWLNVDTQGTHDAIVASLQNEFFQKAKPGQTWYRAWTDEGIMNASGVIAYDLTGVDVAMPSAGYMPVLGDVTYG